VVYGPPTSRVVNTDAVEATLSNGMLCITLPKNPEAKPKKITLKSSGTH